MFTTALALMVAAGILAHSVLLLRDNKLERVVRQMNNRLHQLENVVFDRTEHAPPPDENGPSAG